MRKENMKLDRCAFLSFLLSLSLFLSIVLLSKSMRIGLSIELRRRKSFIGRRWRGEERTNERCQSINKNEEIKVDPSNGIEDFPTSSDDWIITTSSVSLSTATLVVIFSDAKASITNQMWRREGKKSDWWWSLIVVFADRQIRNANDNKVVNERAQKRNVRSSPGEFSSTLKVKNCHDKFIVD